MPMPVLMLSAYEVENEKPCAMLAVWGGISNEKELTITVASEHHTLKGILARTARCRSTSSTLWPSIG